MPSNNVKHLKAQHTAHKIGLIIDNYPSISEGVIAGQNKI